MRTAIIGCGYLGLELGPQLDAAGHDVVGVRRSEEGLDAVAQGGLEPFRADANDPDGLDAVPDVDWLVYAASAGRGGDRRATYVEGLETVVEHFDGREAPVDRLVYTSSTGVYGDHDGALVDEGTPLAPETERERALVDAEFVARDAPMDSTVARLGGIYGPGRYPVDRYLEGPLTEGYRNQVHVADAAGAIASLLAEDLARNEVVLVVDDEPVSRPELGAWLAQQVGASPPETRSKADLRGDDSVSAARKSRRLADKRCSNRRLRELGYEFTYPTFREGYREAVDAYGADGAAGSDAERMADSAYGEPIAHGALVFSIMTGLVWQAREESDVVAFYGVDCLRFPAPVFVGDTVHAELEVTDVEDTDHQDAEALVRQEAVVRNQDGEAVLTCEPLAFVG
jgi:nucleoside-diphosphate-sugar epimerase